MFEAIVTGIIGTAIGTLIGGLIVAWWQWDRLGKLEDRIVELEKLKDRIVELEKLKDRIVALENEKEKGSRVLTEVYDGSGKKYLIPNP